MSSSDGKFQRAKRELLLMISLEVSTLKLRIIDYRLGCRVRIFTVYFFRFRFEPFRATLSQFFDFTLFIEPCQISPWSFQLLPFVNYTFLSPHRLRITLEMIFHFQKGQMCNQELLNNRPSLSHTYHVRRKHPRDFQSM